MGLPLCSTVCGLHLITSTSLDLWSRLGERAGIDDHDLGSVGHPYSLLASHSALSFPLPECTTVGYTYCTSKTSPSDLIHR